MSRTTARSDTLPVVRATRFIEPLREGGSLPGLMEADDLGTYVVKFTGAGQGTAPLTAELIVTGLAHHLGIKVPRLTLIDVDAEFGRREPDPEIQHLLLSSEGINLGIDFLPRALGYAATTTVNTIDAASVLWLDALTVNVDRTWRNPNLLIWHGDLWAIDHGAALLFQHTWPAVEAFANRPYPLADHALGEFADAMTDADARLRPLVTQDLLYDIVATVPDPWFQMPPGIDDVPSVRARYVDYLAARAMAAPAWVAGVST